MFEIIEEMTLINIPIFSENTLPILFILLPLSNILISISLLQNSLSFPQILQEVTLINISIFVVIDTFTMLLIL